MLNYKNITQATETLLKAQLSDDYLIERNTKRPESSYFPAQKDGWIGIYRKPRIYEAAYITSNQPWMVQIQLSVEVMVVSTLSAEDCEDKLMDAENDVLTSLASRETAYRNLGGTVAHIKGYEVEDTLDEQDDQRYFQGITITILAEVRA